MLANLHLLFWLSLVPFATGWMGENNFAPLTITVYTILLNLCGLACYILQTMIFKTHHRGNTPMQTVMRKQGRKGMISLIFYSSAIPLAWVHPVISGAVFILVAVMWLVPDRNIEKVLNDE
jgi:uncharacterized membrane protein